MLLEAVVGGDEDVADVAGDPPGRFLGHFRRVLLAIHVALVHPKARALNIW